MDPTQHVLCLLLDSVYTVLDKQGIFTPCLAVDLGHDPESKEPNIMIRARSLHKIAYYRVDITNIALKNNGFDIALDNLIPIKECNPDRIPWLLLHAGCSCAH